jgi:hypothetical protein
VLSVSLALAQLRNDEFEVAWLPGYAHCKSMLEMTVQWSFTGAIELRIGES